MKKDAGRQFAGGGGDYDMLRVGTLAPELYSLLYIQAFGIATYVWPSGCPCVCCPVCMLVSSKHQLVALNAHAIMACTTPCRALPLPAWAHLSIFLTYIKHKLTITCSFTNVSITNYAIATCSQTACPVYVFRRG
jgi:hypothetical protein